MGSKKQPLFGMERSIVHYNHGSLFQRRQKLVGKPKFKKPAVHGSVILKRCKNPAACLSGDNATALILSTTNLSKHLLAPRRIPIFSIIVKNGIYLAGGGALLRGLDKRLTDKIGIQFHIAEDPLLAVAKGTGVALKNINNFSFLIR